MGNVREPAEQAVGIGGDAVPVAQAGFGVDGGVGGRANSALSVIFRFFLGVKKFDGVFLCFGICEGSWGWAVVSFDVCCIQVVGLR